MTGREQVLKELAGAAIDPGSLTVAELVERTGRSDRGVRMILRVLCEDALLEPEHASWEGMAWSGVREVTLTPAGAAEVDRLGFAWAVRS